MGKTIGERKRLKLQTYRKLHICKSFSHLRLSVPNDADSGHPIFLSMRIASLRYENRLEKRSQIFFLAHKIQVSDEHTLPCISIRSIHKPFPVLGSYTYEIYADDPIHETRSVACQSCERCSFIWVHRWWRRRNVWRPIEGRNRMCE